MTPKYALAQCPLFLSLIFFFIPAYGQAQSEQAPSLVDKAQLITENLFSIETKLAASRKQLDQFKDSKQAEQEKENVKKLEADLNEASRQDFHDSPEQALTKARRLQGFLEKYNNSTKDGERAAAQAMIEKQMRALEHLEKAQQEKEKQLEVNKNQAELEKRLEKFGLGVAMGAVIDVGGRDRIESASLDPNGIVRIEQDSNTRANLMLEGHYFWSPDIDFPIGFTTDKGEKWFSWTKNGNWGFGPFIAIQPGSQNIIEAVGAGVMIGFKRTAILSGTKPLPVGDSFNLGVGAMLDVRQKVLGDGIRVNERLPAGETAIRFRETSQIGAVILFSYSFY